jgi:hypothetical protein
MANETIVANTATTTNVEAKTTATITNMGDGVQYPYTNAKGEQKNNFRICVTKNNVNKWCLVAEKNYHKMQLGELVNVTKSGSVYNASRIVNNEAEDADFFA